MECAEADAASAAGVEAPMVRGYLAVFPSDSIGDSWAEVK